MPGLTSQGAVTRTAVVSRQGAPTGRACAGAPLVGAADRASAEGSSSAELRAAPDTCDGGKLNSKGLGFHFTVQGFVSDGGGLRETHED